MLQKASDSLELYFLFDGEQRNGHQCALFYFKAWGATNLHINTCLCEMGSSGFLIMIGGFLHIVGCSRDHRDLSCLRVLFSLVSLLPSCLCVAPAGLYLCSTPSSVALPWFLRLALVAFFVLAAFTFGSRLSFFAHGLLSLFVWFRIICLFGFEYSSLREPLRIPSRHGICDSGAFCR